MGPSVAGVAALRDVEELGDGVAAFDADWHLSPKLTGEYRRWKSGRWTLIKIILLAMAIWYHTVITLDVITGNYCRNGLGPPIGTSRRF